MVLDCNAVGSIHANAPPNPSLSHTHGDWVYDSRLLDEDWIISKFSSEVKKMFWYKLKPRAQLTVAPTQDTSGMDILCLLNDSPTETKAMIESGYTHYCKCLSLECVGASCL